MRPTNKRYVARLLRDEAAQETAAEKASVKLEDQAAHRAVAGAFSRLAARLEDTRG